MITPTISKDVLLSAFQRSPDHYYVKDLESRFVWVSDSLALAFGCTAEEIIGKTDADFFPDRAEEFRQAEREMIRTGKSIDNRTVKHVWPDGRVTSSLNESMLVEDEKGEVVALWGHNTDITQLKATEAALAQSERRFRAFVGATSDVVYRKGPDWSEIRNPQGQEVIPDSSLDSSGNRLEKYIHPDDQARVKEAIREAIRAKNTLKVEHRILRDDGTLGWIFSRAVPLLDECGEIVEWFGTASDVTARKQAETKLQAQLARLALLSQITRAVGERQDIKSIFQVVIRTLEEHLPVDFCSICLYEPEAKELTVTSVGKHSEPLAIELAMTEHAHIPIDKNGLSQCVQGQLVYEPNLDEVPSPFPQRLLRGGLGAFVVAPLLVESEVFGVLVTARHERYSFSSGECEFLRQLSEHVALATHQAKLHNALQRAYDDLRQTQQAVMQQERLLALGKMASGIAHDINNAISPVALYTETLLEHAPELSPRTRQYLETIQRAIDDVAHTVSRMREFYRPPERETVMRRVHLNELVQQVIDLTRARWSDMAQQRGIAIKVEAALAPDLPAILGVEGELRDALTNLIFNAVDAMPEGGSLILRTQVLKNANAGVGRATAQELVQVEVLDSGVGMDEDTRRRCFEPFFTTKGERGTGLGLAMVYGTVRRHSADIDIDSTVGKGTTVRLSFAVANSADDIIGVDRPVSVAPSLRILLVDDDPIVLKSLGDILKVDGHAVASADGGQAGIDAFLAAKSAGSPFQVVVTDLGMPHVDGRRVSAAVKAAAPETIVLLLTGWGQRLIDDGDIPAHVDRVLSKPPKLRELRETLAQTHVDRA
jgi:PAS domain S-box-containing protein